MKIGGNENQWQLKSVVMKISGNESNGNENQRQ